MSKLTKKAKLVEQIYDKKKHYSLTEGIEILHKMPSAKFDESIDIAVQLGLQVQKGEVIRGVVQLPHGRGKKVKVLVLCTPEYEEQAKQAGADYVGQEEYLKKIEQGWTEIDAIVTIPTLMGKVGKLGKVLGPRGLMPSPKTNTVTTKVAEAVKNIKAGSLNIRTEKKGIVHANIAKKSFSAEKISENIEEFFKTIWQLKPNTAKGPYVKSVTLSTTMGGGVKIDLNSIKR